MCELDKITVPQSAYVGSGHVTAALQLVPATLRISEHPERTGPVESFTVTVKEQVAVRPEPSVAV
jgi:hypothetical protein